MCIEYTYTLLYQYRSIYGYWDVELFLFLYAVFRLLCIFQWEDLKSIHFYLSRISSIILIFLHLVASTFQFYYFSKQIGSLKFHLTYIIQQLSIHSKQVIASHFNWFSDVNFWIHSAVDATWASKQSDQLYW